ncbi:MAG: hypothetical protein GFH27_549279n407 [Chloroflexi bacterium AL-W]|nr:hypothetical protein [Chloroflexi bacterium AL-N1]NOK65373.1 hypothetical protein [Chloroflexi bacterium AL-N10]NOK72361.1 hypothetical protein [Chloroflexi bacterium AL-N5]NOK79552.1 hypothetical protein [Chloroflexi bacterium AL-W]NOK87468.1 hypothetical protein [Chloroflexi bacterium AL-N15]
MAGDTMEVLEGATSLYFSLATVISVLLGIGYYIWRINVQSRDIQRRLDRMQHAKPTLNTTNTILQRRDEIEQTNQAAGNTPQE